MSRLVILAIIIGVSNCMDHDTYVRQRESMTNAQRKFGLKLEQNLQRIEVDYASLKMKDVNDEKIAAKRLADMGLHLDQLELDLEAHEPVFTRGVKIFEEMSRRVKSKADKKDAKQMVRAMVKRQKDNRSVKDIYRKLRHMIDEFDVKDAGILEKMRTQIVRLNRIVDENS